MSLQTISKRLARVVLIPALFLSVSARSFGTSIILEGQSKDVPGTWVSGNLQNWQELDYIPCRVHWLSAKGSNQVVEIDFEHRNNSTPGIENLFNFATSANVVFSAPPALLAPPTASTWSYTFTVDILDDQAAYVYFSARIAAGGHINVGSSLSIGGKPSAMGNLQIHKPAPGPGTPDLMVLKNGPATAKPGDIITYTLSYTNQASGLNTATGVQLSDTLPSQIVVDPNNIPAGGILVGNTIYWDLPNLTIRAGGQITFPAQVSSSAGFGVSFTNTAQILSAENDLNYSDDTSTQVTTTVGCAQPSMPSSPSSLMRCSGDSITFVPVVNGTEPLSYQWLKNGSNIPGETGSSCTIAAISPADAGVYSVVVTNLCGSATSASTTLIVNTNASATPLSDLQKCPGDTATFSTIPGGTGPFSYVWRKDGAPLAETNSTLAIPSVLAADAGTYSVEVSGACGLSISNSATLTVLPLPLITCLPNKAIPFGTAWNFDLPAANYAVVLVQTTTNMAGHCDGTFDVTRTWAATDPCGNSVQCSQTVTTLGTNAPALNCSSNKTVQLGTAWNFDDPTVADTGITNLTISVLSTVTNTAGHCAGGYEAIRTWLATDACGNSSSCSQSVSVMSTTQPAVSIISPTNGAVFVVPADVTLLADAQDFGSAIGQVAFFSGTNKLGEVTNGPPYFIVLTNLAAGTYELTATASNVCGNTATSAAVSMVVIERPPVTIVSSMHYDPQTDFVEQTVRVTNPTYSTYDAVRVYVSNLTNSPAITVHNASGSSNGVPYVESHAQVLPGTYVDLQIEYYSPLRISPNPILSGQLVSLSGSAGAAVIGVRQHINRGLFLPNKTFLVEFASISNRLYYVQYSSDFITWQTSQPALVGSGTWIQWLDNGEPKTDSAPATQSRRFYQLLLLP